MLILVIAVLLIAGAVSFFYFSYNDGESVTINWMDQTGVFPMAWIPYALLFLVLFLFALWLLSQVFSVPKRLRRSGESRSMRKSRESLDQGLMEIQNGEFEKGEATITSHIDGKAGDAVKYIAAARSAQERGADGQAEHFLKKASDASNESGTAVRMAQAEMLLKQGNFRDAETLLTNLHLANPKNAHIMGLLATAFEGTGNSTKLSELTNLMRRKTSIPVDRIVPVENKAWGGMMSSSSSDNLTDTWQSLPAAAQNESNVVAIYASQLIEAGDHDRAETVLQKALNNKWSEELAGLYGELDNANTPKQLEQADRWLANNPRSPALSLAIGKLSARRELWGKARESLIRSAELELTTETCSELATVLESMGDTDQARDCLKSAVALATGKAPVGIMQDVKNLAKNLGSASIRKVAS